MRLPACLFALLIPFAAHSAPPVLGDLPSTELQEVIALADAADRQWNARDAQGLAALYVDDANLALVVQGSFVAGRAAIADYFTRSFAAMPATLRHTTVVDRVTVLDADHVLADTSVALDRQLESGEYERVRDFATMTIAVREHGGWKLQAVRAHALTAPVPAG